MHPPSPITKSCEFGFCGANLSEGFSGCPVHTPPANRSSATHNFTVGPSTTTDYTTMLNDGLAARSALATFWHPANTASSRLYCMILLCYRQLRSCCLSSPFL